MSIYYRSNAPSAGGKFSEISGKMWNAICMFPPSLTLIFLRLISKDNNWSQIKYIIFQRCSRWGKEVSKLVGRGKAIKPRNGIKDTWTLVSSHGEEKAPTFRLQECSSLVGWQFYLSAERELKPVFFFFLFFPFIFISWRLITLKYCSGFCHTLTWISLLNKRPTQSRGLSSLVAQMVKNLPIVRETWVWTLGQEDTWRREWLPTPVFLPGKLHGQRSLVGYISWGSKRVRHDWATNTFKFHFFHPSLNISAR